MTWRVGQEFGDSRYIYGEDGHYVGQMFTPALAARVVEAVNGSDGEDWHEAYTMAEKHNDELLAEVAERVAERDAARAEVEQMRARLAALEAVAAAAIMYRAAMSRWEDGVQEGSAFRDELWQAIIRALDALGKP